jgi:hypothetical protein
MVYLLPMGDKFSADFHIAVLFVDAISDVSKALK